MLEIIVHVKHWSFRYMTSLAIVIGAGLIIFVGLQPVSLDWKSVVTAVSVGLSLVYFIQKQRLEELKLFKELFEKFNQRYDDLNDDLARIVNIDPVVELTPPDKAKLVDYFNLCGEEYLYYRLGYIYPEVWKAWLRGMQQYYGQEHIGRIWREELKSDSYYGLSAALLGSGSRRGNRAAELVAAGGATSGPNVR